MNQTSKTLSKQEHTSHKTCINHLPALFKKISWTYGQIGTVNLDMGGGKYKHATDYLYKLGVKNLIYDPYNQDEETNKFVARYMKNFKADSATCSNVLCVIKEKEVRLEVIKQIHDWLKTYSYAYFSCYRGEGNKGRKTCNGWQNNKPLKWYLPEIQQFFPHAYINDGMIVALKTK